MKQLKAKFNNLKSSCKRKNKNQNPLSKEEVRQVKLKFDKAQRK